MSSKEKIAYRYYARRPLEPGAIPDTREYPPQEVKNFDERVDVSSGAGRMAAWGYVDYPVALPADAASQFELEAARENEDVQARLEHLARLLGPVEDECGLPERRRYTLFDETAGCYLVVPCVSLKKVEERVALVV